MPLHELDGDTSNPPQVMVPFQAYEREIQKLMQLLEHLGVEIPDHSELRSDQNKAFQFLYYALFAEERPPNLDEQLARIQAGLGDLATKINKAWEQPGAGVLIPHLAKMVRGAVRMNDPHCVTDDAANKTCELYVGCLALGRGWRVALDDPDRSSGGSNPDVMIDRRTLDSGGEDRSRTTHDV
jgi:hypothetical protein